MNYLFQKFDLNAPSQVSLFDELSLWSSYFGQLLLDNIPMHKGMHVLDVGFGLGFPLLEIAQRLGRSGQVTGVDPWDTALKIAESKAKRLGLNNVELYPDDAAKMRFNDNFFDLIVSNVGVNNFEEPDAVLKECHRVLKPKGRICLTSNLQGHFAEFYQAYKLVIKDLGLNQLLPMLEQEAQHRSTKASVKKLLEEADFSVGKVIQEKFQYRFMDGEALLNHLLCRVGFLDGWRSFLLTGIEEKVFQHLEKKLNEQAAKEGELKMTVPVIYIEAEK